MIYIVLSKTEGSGKSTISSQLIAPYLYNKSKKVQTITQLCNKSIDYLSYSQSNFIKHEMINDNNWEKIDKIFERKEDIIFDVNIEYNLKILNYIEKKYKEIENLTFIIPLTDRNNENKNLDYILKIINKKVLSPNIMLVFNKVHDVDDLKFQYFNIFGYENLGIYEVEDLDKYNKIMVKYNPILNICNKFNSLVVDFSSKENILRLEKEEKYYNDKLISEDNEDKKKILFEKMDIVIAKKKLVNKAILFTNETKEILF